VPLRAEGAHTSELGTLRFLAETRLKARRQTLVWPGGPGNSKGRNLPLAVQRNVVPPVKFSCVGLTVLGHKRMTRSWPDGMATTAPFRRLVSCVGFTTEVRIANSQPASVAHPDVGRVKETRQFSTNSGWPESSKGRFS
jgi:hypothetical protein